ncbi:SDR family oxidoreductase [Erwinia sp. AnSW2-5]|uniref:SDR family oxidoreductase n=1 Tax=Erwinia sp. AnSW2-5 TaxID=3367692 RepID=UPI00385DC87A
MNSIQHKRTALVLGGSRGLGLGVAAALVQRGIDVALVGRDVSALHAAGEHLAGHPGSVTLFACDLQDSDSVSRLLADVSQRLNSIDIILLNGGGPPPFAASGFDEALWQTQFTAMFLSQVRIATHFLPAMRQRGFGRVLAVSSTSIREPIADLTASNALRSALAAWAKTLAAEVAREGVTVNVVLPGRFATERTTRLDAMDAEDRGVDRAVIAAESQQQIPVGRYGTVEEFGTVVAFLASEDAGYITGIALPVDGGLSRSML